MYLHIPNPLLGPQVFVTDGEHGECGQPIGVWLNLSRHFEELVESLRVAGIVPARMAVVDQLGCGPVMIDEDAELVSLRQAVSA